MAIPLLSVGQTLQSQSGGNWRDTWIGVHSVNGSHLSYLSVHSLWTALGTDDCTALQEPLGLVIVLV